ncbi:Dicarboxylate transport [Sphingomonas gellani]|uniref:Dicarboxylate transport n=1 Tax=Sphingomonas gellani TaxID=1166340 RepID=A0A1H7YQQ4_9SPHN|nr:Dicarboxylate transport [Sphingomonas gellani]
MLDGQEQDETPEGRPGRRWRHRHRHRHQLAAGTATVLLCAAGGLWLARKPVAEHFINRELARRGVAAHYRITNLGFGRQRLTDVTIGDPTHPDLTADWIETQTVVRLFGARLDGVRAGHVRLRARIADGRLTLGSIDRLLPQSSGGPARLPEFDLDLQDGRVALATPAGPVALRLSGKGRLSGGFDGRILGRADRLALSGCAASGMALDARVTTKGGAPTLTGPLGARRMACGEAAVERPIAKLAVGFGSALDRLDGQVALTSAAFRHPNLSAAAVQATLNGHGTARSWVGRAELAARDVAGAPGRAQEVTAAGGLRVDDGHVAVVADPQGSGGTTGLLIGVRNAAVAPRWRALATKWATAGANSPVGPIARQVASRVDQAARLFDARAGVEVTDAPGTRSLTIRSVVAHSASGARLVSDQPLDLFASNWWRMPIGQGRISLSGGGLPKVRVETRPRRSGERLGATVAMAPYAAGAARLATTPIDVSVTRQGWQASGRAVMSGPMSGGFVEGLDLPLAVRSLGNDIAVNPGCSQVGWRRLATGGLVLAPATLRVCAEGEALVAVKAGRVGGGGRIGLTRLKGRLGGTPLTLDWAGARGTLADARFALTGVAARLGSGDRVSRLDVAALDGRFGGGGIGGGFSGADGRIGAVPLALSNAEGRWRFAQQRLSLSGALKVSDTATPARFEPLAAKEVALTLVDGVIHAAGALTEPTTGSHVADVVIDHRLANGSGNAVLRVPGVTFSKTLQPDQLTRLTFGVVADVRGIVKGEGRIAWTVDGVTSSGDFGTDGMDLAAAFGPVTGLQTHIHFTDLLALESAPGQIATIASINPGVPVENGTASFQLLPNARVRVEGARWPFAGGTLTLEPALLDFGTAGERRMTFTVAGVAADQFLQQFDFKNLEATGTFDGTLPMVFDVNGGRIENGKLEVRAGGGSIAYLGEVSRRNLGFWGNLAFGALRSLRYRDLRIAMNGPLAGEMVTDVRFSGISQGKGAISNVLIRRLQRLPFVFNVRIKAPFRGLIDSAQGFYDPSRLISRNLPALIEQQNRVAIQATPSAATVQPPASHTPIERDKDGR